jgi:hypothetical protein
MKRALAHRAGNNEFVTAAFDELDFEYATSVAEKSHAVHGRAARAADAE